MHCISIFVVMYHNHLNSTPVVAAALRWLPHNDMPKIRMNISKNYDSTECGKNFGEI